MKKIISAIVIITIITLLGLGAWYSYDVLREQRKIMDQIEQSMG